MDLRFDVLGLDGRDDDVETWRPIFAAAELYDSALRASGLDPERLGAVRDALAEGVTFKKGRTPPTMDQLIDPTLWRDAQALRGK